MPSAVGEESGAAVRGVVVRQVRAAGIVAGGAGSTAEFVGKVKGALELGVEEELWLVAAVWVWLEAEEAVAAAAVGADFEPTELQHAEPEPVKGAWPQSQVVSGQRHCWRQQSFFS